MIILLLLFRDERTWIRFRVNGLDQTKLTLLTKMTSMPTGSQRLRWIGDAFVLQIT